MATERFLPKSCFKGQGRIDAFYLTYMGSSGMRTRDMKPMTEEVRLRLADNMSYMMGSKDAADLFPREEVLNDLSILASRVCGIAVMEDPFTLDKF